MSTKDRLLVLLQTLQENSDDDKHIRHGEWMIKNKVYQK